MAAQNFDFTTRAYINCSSIQCDNPFYGQECAQELRVLFFIPLYKTPDCQNDPAYDWIKNETLPRGVYGTPPPDSFAHKHIKLIALVLFVLAFVLNHYAHNRGRPFDIEIRISEKHRINMDTFKKLKETKE